MATDREGYEFSYNGATDIFTFSGHQISGELLRTMTASPLGVSFRLTERKDGVITVSQDRDPRAALAEAINSIPTEHYWLLAKGRVSPDEPLYAVQLIHARSERILAETENDDLAQCISDAVEKLKAA